MNVTHNIVHHFRQQDGISQQAAYDRVGSLLQDRYRKWYLAHSEVPLCWGEKVDTDVQLYLKGCLDVALANLNWRYVLPPLPLSFRSITEASSAIGRHH